MGMVRAILGCVRGRWDDGSKFATEVELLEEWMNMLEEGAVPVDEMRDRGR